MCGIVGVVDFTRAADAQRIRQAAMLLRRRGPDDSGEWIEGGVGFGHRRLSILDLSTAGHQPMKSADGRFVITFNGEIYNYRTLRDEIDPDASAWQSNSDTEVILKAYLRWGAACVERFHGMFAFALWDRLKSTLFAARDRMGVKPLYYNAGPNRFAFASRPRAVFAAAPDLSREIDNQGLRFFLEAGYIPAPWSIHAAVRKLPPGHWLTFDRSGLNVHRYWEFRTITPVASSARRAEEDLLDELNEIVSRSVKLRMVSDVPLGAFLSGGIDSSLVVAVMRKLTSQPVRTFTVGFNDPEYDESKHAQAVAQQLETRHECETLHIDDLLALLPLFREEYDEPFFDSSAFPTLAVSRMARRSVTVSLSGDGGDELFGGYHYYRIVQGLAPAFGLPVAMRRWLSGAVGLLSNHQAKLLAGAIRQQSLYSAFAFSRSISKDFPSVLSPEIAASTIGLKELFEEAASSFPSELPAPEGAMRLDAQYTLPDDYLQKVDVGTMAFSLEGRDPLLDQELVEWAMRLPLRWKLRSGGGKYLLRRLLHRYVSPEIVDRPKQGFRVPIDRWLRGPLHEWARVRLEDRRAFDALPLNRSKLLELLRLHKSGARNVYPLLWAALVLLDTFSQPVATSASAVTIHT